MGKTSIKVLVNEARKLAFQTLFFLSESGNNSLQKMKFWGYKNQGPDERNPIKLSSNVPSTSPSPPVLGQLFPTPLSSPLFLYLPGLDKKQTNKQFLTRTDRKRNLIGQVNNY